MSFRNIGQTLGRNASSLSREFIRNNTKKEIGYMPDTAHILASDRKAKHGLKIDQYPDLKEQIFSWMKEDRFSPEIIAGRLIPIFTNNWTNNLYCKRFPQFLSLSF